MQRLVIAGAFVVMALALAGFQRTQTVRLQESVRANCQAGNELRHVLVTYIVGQLNSGERSLHKIEYYRRHPRELVDAVRRIEKQRRDTRREFAPRTCP